MINKAMNFTQRHYLSLNSKGFHTIVYSDWGDVDAQPIICVHGLTGNGSDFSYLAQALITQGYRVICIDLPGRGRSDFLANPLDYRYSQYCNDLVALLAHLRIDKPNSVDWIGTSLGGLLGMRLAGTQNSPIRRLILNDIGPTVPQKALDFIHMVISQPYEFENVEEMEARMRETRGQTYGPLTDEQWAYMATHNARTLENGKLSYGYDPQIAVVFEGSPIGDADLWKYWERIHCPIMLIWGEKSLLLTKGIIKEMQRREDTGSKPAPMHLTTFKDCGHVPSLMAAEHIEAIEQWLEKTP